MAVFPPRVTIWVTDIEDNAPPMFSLADKADFATPTAKTNIERERDTFVNLLENFVTPLTAAELADHLLVIDLQTAALTAIPVLDRRWLAKAVAEVIKAELAKPTKAPGTESVVVKAIEADHAAVVAAMEGGGKTGEDYRDDLVAFFTPALLATLSPAPAAPGAPVVPPAAATPAATPVTVVDHHDEAVVVEEEEEPIEGFEVMRAKGDLYFGLAIVLPFTIGAALVIDGGVDTLRLMFGEQITNYADILKVPKQFENLALQMPIGACLVFVSRLLATPLDVAHWKETKKTNHSLKWKERRGWALGAFTTVNMAAGGVTAVCLILLALVGLNNLPAPVWTRFHSGLSFEIAFMFILAWADALRKFFLINHENGKSVKDTLRAAMMQSGMGIFYGGIAVALLSMMGFGLASKVLGVRAEEARVAEVKDAETRAKIEAAEAEAVASLKASCQQRIAALEDAAKEGETYIDFCLATDSQVIRAECIAVGEDCS